MFKLETGKCLIVPDIHQNIGWANSILERELSLVDHIVFLGDYFDSRRKNVHGVRETAIWLKAMKSALGEKVTFLLGNHDIPYMSSRFKGYNLKEVRYACSGFTASKAEKIHKEFNYSFWENFEFFKLVNGVLISHAGLSELFWYPVLAPEEVLTKLYDRLEFVRRNIWGGPHDALLMGGISRGGENAVGGITWQDWELDFTDGIPYPQIVGHTSKFVRPRKIGRSYCIDCFQTYYGILDGNVLTVKDSDGNVVNEPFPEY